MIAERGIPIVEAMAGSAGSYWAGTGAGELIRHSFWLFDSGQNARDAEATFNRVREMPDPPSTFVSVDVSDAVGQWARNQRGAGTTGATARTGGYVLKGKVALTVDSREEVYEPGDAFYIPPGHLQRADADTESLEFIPAKEMAEVSS